LKYRISKDQGGAVSYGHNDAVQTAPPTIIHQPFLLKSLYILLYPTKYSSVMENAK